MVAKTKAKKTVRKVVKGLKKASKSHAKQAKTLASLKLKKGGPAKKSKSMPSSVALRSLFCD